MCSQASRNAHKGRGAVGGGIFAKTAKTPPLQSGVCGEGIALSIAPKGRLHARTMPPRVPP